MFTDNFPIQVVQKRIIKSLRSKTELVLICEQILQTTSLLYSGLSDSLIRLKITMGSQIERHYFSHKLIWCSKEISGGWQDC